MASSVTTYSRGRINIIGEHTDYNDGFVLPAAIDKKTTVNIKRNGMNSICNIIAENKNETYQFDLKNYKPIASGWQNYVMGVVHEIEKLGANLEGFDASFFGTVPIGSGMSSSAALECSFALALNELFELGLDKWQIIKLSQRAEHNFVGMKCGIMDQFASVMGKQNHVMLLDCRSLEFEYIPLELGAFQLLLLNTNISHALADSAYNERKNQCEEGVEFLKKYYPDRVITNLRDVTFEMLQHVQSKISELVFKRCDHVLRENYRVFSAKIALQSGDLKELGKLMYASHHSLQNDYEVSCKELDFLVEKAADLPYVLGSRMMGGGFGGCTINLIKKENVESFIDWISDEYKNEFGIALTSYEVSVEDGGGVLRKN